MYCIYSSSFKSLMFKVRCVHYVLRTINESVLVISSLVFFFFSSYRSKAREKISYSGEGSIAPLT